MNDFSGYIENNQPELVGNYSVTVARLILSA